MPGSTSIHATALSATKAVAAALLIQACGGVAVAQPAAKARAIEGIWESTVTPKDCASGAALGPPFLALIIFRRGGTFDLDGVDGAAQSGNVYGLWEHGAGSAYTANAVHQRSNPDGSYAGVNKIKRNLTLAADADSFTSSLTVRIFDLNGNVVAEVCPTEAAVRLSL